MGSIIEINDTLQLTEEQGFPSEFKLEKHLDKPYKAEDFEERVFEFKILECLRSGEKCIHEIVPAIHGEQSNISRHISLMQKNHIVTTRKDGVRVMVKVRDPKVFEILDKVGAILKNQVKKQEKLLARI